LSISSTNRMTSNLVAKAISSILLWSLRSTLTRCIVYIHIMRSTHVFPFFTSLYLSFSLSFPFFLSFSLSYMLHFLSFFFALLLFISFSLTFCLLCFHSFLFSLSLVLPSFKHTNIKRKYRDAKLWDLYRSTRLAQRDMSIGLLLKYVYSYHPNLWARLSCR